MNKASYTIIISVLFSCSYLLDIKHAQSGSDQNTIYKGKTLIKRDVLHNLTLEFDDAIYDNWLSLYPGCSREIERLDLHYFNHLNFSRRRDPLAVPIVNRLHQQFEFFYSEKRKYEYDTKKNVLVSYFNDSNPRILYICDKNKVPQLFINQYDAYLINQQFLVGHREGGNIEIKDGAKFLEQECRLDYHNKKYKKARSICELAALNENIISANYYMGMLYRFNSGGNLDFRKSYDHTLQAANDGFSPAYAWLAWHYEFGKGIPVDHKSALIWRIAAVKAGDLRSARSVARFYMQGLGVNVDFTEAADWLLVAAKAGEPHAQNKLACMYVNSLGLKQDLDQAYYWLNESYQQGNEKATYNLAVLYKHNKYSRRDSVIAESFYKQAKEMRLVKESDIVDKYDRIWSEK